MSTDKLDKHTLSFPGRHTLEGQHEQHCSARVSHLPQPSREERRKRRAKEARGRQGACTQAMVQCLQPWPLMSAWHAPRILPLA